MDRYGDTFPSRAVAGRLLAARLSPMHLKDPVVLALPRGGVPVAVEIARALHAPLDVVLVRKIGAPGMPELALGAVVDGGAAQTVINADVWRATGADDRYLAQARRRELAEIERRRTIYLGARPRVDPAGRTVIVVDDGLATGATAKAALAAVKAQGAVRTVLAVPVAPPSTLGNMASCADHIVCLLAPADFSGVGAFYDDFHQLSDDETISLLRSAWTADG